MRVQYVCVNSDYQYPWLVNEPWYKFFGDDKHLDTLASKQFRSVELGYILGDFYTNSSCHPAQDAAPDWAIFCPFG
jgi:hypothetical protein